MTWKKEKEKVKNRLSFLFFFYKLSNTAFLR